MILAASSHSMTVQHTFGYIIVVLAGLRLLSLLSPRIRKKTGADGSNAGFSLAIVAVMILFGISLLMSP